MKKSKNNKYGLNEELELFKKKLSSLLPRYIELLNRDDLCKEEHTELGDLEYMLIGINGKIADIKNMLEHDLFGESIEYYYKLKQMALGGDFKAKVKLDNLRNKHTQKLNNAFINWN